MGKIIDLRPRLPSQPTVEQTLEAGLLDVGVDCPELAEVVARLIMAKLEELETVVNVQLPGSLEPEEVDAVRPQLADICVRAATLLAIAVQEATLEAARHLRR